jgi:hypothetical protein
MNMSPAQHNADCMVEAFESMLFSGSSDFEHCGSSAHGASHRLKSFGPGCVRAPGFRD